jgi:hypothetical protein
MTAKDPSTNAGIDQRDVEGMLATVIRILMKVSSGEYSHSRKRKL